METIQNAHDAAKYLRHLVTTPEQEELFVICLNGSNEIKASHICGLGGDDSVTICNKIIARHAILDVAKGIIIGHTHPSGNPLPSRADIEATEKLHKALEYLDISLIDHVIVCDKKFYSFSEERVINF